MILSNHFRNYEAARRSTLIPGFCSITCNHHSGQVQDVLLSHLSFTMEGQSLWGLGPEMVA
jgi:hypothetical protein